MCNVYRADTDGWTKVQELSLVRAFKEFGKDTADRWERIASAVPGRSKVQCQRRMVELRTRLREAKEEEKLPTDDE